MLKDPVLRYKKGAPKSAGLKNLDYWRAHPVEGKEVFVDLASDVLGSQPVSVEIVLLGDKPEDVFSWRFAQWNKGGLVHACDEDGFLLRYKQDGEYWNARRPGEPEGARTFEYGTKMCPYHSGQRQRTKDDPGCKPEGYLTGFSQTLVSAAVEAGISGVGPITFETHSLHDCVYLSTWIDTLYRQRTAMGFGSLNGVKLVVSRIMRTIKMSWQGGSKQEKQPMIGLALDSEYTSRMLSILVERSLEAPVDLSSVNVAVDSNGVMETVEQRMRTFEQGGYDEGLEEEGLSEGTMERLRESQNVTESVTNGDSANTPSDAPGGDSSGVSGEDRETPVETPKSPENQQGSKQEPSGEGGSPFNAQEIEKMSAPRGAEHKWTEDEVNKMFSFAKGKDCYPVTLLRWLGTDFTHYDGDPKQTAIAFSKWAKAGFPDEVLGSQPEVSESEPEEEREKEDDNEQAPLPF